MPRGWPRGLPRLRRGVAQPRRRRMAPRPIRATAAAASAAIRSVRRSPDSVRVASVNFSLADSTWRRAISCGAVRVCSSSTVPASRSRAAAMSASIWSTDRLAAGDLAVLVLAHAGAPWWIGRVENGRQVSPRSRRSLATCPVALTLYKAFETLPSSSTTTVLRRTPSTVLP